MSLDDVRRSYASSIGLRAGVRSERLLEALAKTPREQFVGPGPWTIAGGPEPPKKTVDDDPVHIYADVSVALDATRNLYNGPPGTLIAWIDALDLRDGDRVFHLGGGTGYYTAIMAEVVGRGGRVVMAEVDEDLGNRAGKLLADRENVEVIVGDGAIHDPGACDAILVNAGVTHPTGLWLDRLKQDGRMLLPLTFEFPNSTLGKGALIKITRAPSGFSAAFLPRPIVIYSCSSVRNPTLNERLLSAYSTQINRIGEVRSVRLDPHETDSTCWVHGDSICFSTLQLS